MTVGRRAALEFLRSCQNAGGGWGYAPGQASAVEPTAAAWLALKRWAQDDLASPALTWLLAGQHADGGWGYSHDDDESGWLTAWALLALGAGAGDPRPLERAAAWLLGVETLRVDDDEMQRESLANNGIDLSIPGWPWLPGEATWVEPTALALRALRRHRHLPGMPERLAQGVECLVSRRCREGGWNVGSPFMLNAFLPARAVPTAWALLALTELAPEHRLPTDEAALRAEMRREDGTLALAWGLAALHDMGSDDPEMAARLGERQLPDGSWEDNPYVTAVALLALPLEGSTT